MLPDLRLTFYRTCVVLATIGVLYLVWRLSDLVIILFLSIIFASTVRPIIEDLIPRSVPRSVSIGFIYIVTIVAIGALVVIGVPPIVQLAIDMSQEDQLAEEVNIALIRSTFLLRQQFQVYVPVLALPPHLTDFLGSVDETVAERAIPVAQTAFRTVGQILLAIVLSIYWLVARGTALKQLLRLTPSAYRKTVYEIWIDTEDTLGRYLRGQLILALTIGLVSYIGLLILRVPNAKALAVMAGLFEVVPFVGPVLAAIPAVFIGFTEAPAKGLLVLLFYIAVQTLEGNFLIPFVMGRGLRLHPMIVLLAITAGFYLNGIVGAILALPVVSALQITLTHVRQFSSNTNLSPERLGP